MFKLDQKNRDRFAAQSSTKPSHAILRLTALTLLMSGFAASQPASAAPLNITYNLTSAAKVSLNIYNSSGQIVRELLHTAARTSGNKTETWDGRDDAGNVLPAATYTWKMLATPGFGATYITNPGSNYKTDNTAPFWAQATGCHGGPETIAVDSTGLYVGGFTENIETALMKQPLNGSSRLWSQKAQAPWACARSLVSTGTALWSRYNGGTVYRQNPTDGTVLGSFDSNYNGEEATDLTANATNVILSYPVAGVVRWLDYTGAQTRIVSVAGANTVDVAADGTVYTISGTDLRKITPTGTTSTVLVSGLVAPKRAAVNQTNGAIYVAQGGTSQQVKRFSSAGALLNTYGVAGGRVDGVYATQKTSFRDIGDIAVESNGNFWVAEALAAPRRVARFNSAGTWIAEWYGGQAWAPWICAEPDDLNYVWMCSAWGDVMRCQINYTSKTWSVESTYRYQGMANGLMSGNDNAPVFEMRMHGGNLYLCRLNNYPQIFKVDRANHKLIPAVRAIGLFWHDPDQYPQWAKDKAAETGAHSMLWTDANGDGLALNPDGSLQAGESQFFGTDAEYGNLTGMMDDFSYIYQRDGIKRYAVTSWNAAGSPVFGNFPIPSLFGSAPPRLTGFNDDRWSAFVSGDTSGNIWGAFNSNVTGWGTSDDAFVARWNSDGTLAWQSGHKGGNVGNTKTFRRIYGFINNGTGSNVMVVAPFSYEWPAEGATPVFAYDQDGLYAGQIIGQPLNTSVPTTKYGLGAEALAGTINQDASGNVYFFGHWINEARIYKITGWTGWKRANGTVTVPTGYVNPAFTQEVVGPNGTGTGLYGQYWTNTDFSGTPAFTQTDAAPGNAGLDFTFTQNWNSPTNTPNWSVRWTGTVKPRRTGWHMFKQERGFSPNNVFVNNVNVMPMAMNSEGWPYDGYIGAGRAVWLTAGTAYPITVNIHDWFGGYGGVQLQWAEPETNGNFVNIPTTQLVPVVPTPVPTPTPTPAS